MVSAAIGGLGGGVIGRAVLEIVTDSSKADEGLSQFQRRVALGTAIAFGAAVTSAAAYETKLAQIHVLGEATVGDIAQFRGQTLALAQLTGQGPDQLAQALYRITSNGQTGANAMAILTSSAKAATAGLGNVDDIAATVTASLNAYGAQNLSAARATDILFAAAKAGGAEASELATSLGRVIPIAAQMGISLADVSAQIAVLTRLGLPTEVAVTGVRAVLLAILDPSTQAKAALAGVDLNMQAIRDTIRQHGLLAGLQVLREEFGQNESAIAQVIPEARALTAFLGTMGNQAGVTAEVTREVNDSMGISSKAFDEVSRTTGVAFKQALQAVNVLLIQLGSEALPPIASLLRVTATGVGALVSVFDKLPEPVRASAVALILLSAAFPLVQAGATRAAAAIAGSGGLVGALSALRTAQQTQGAAAASAAVFEGAEAKAAAQAIALRVGVGGAAAVIGSFAASSDNAAVSLLGMTAQGAGLGAVVGGPVGAAIGGAIGLLIGFAGAADRAAAAEDRFQAAVAKRGAELANGQKPDDIRAQLRSTTARRDELAKEIQSTERDASLPTEVQAVRLAQLNKEYQDVNKSAFEWANALSIATRGTELTANETERLAKITGGSLNPALRESADQYAKIGPGALGAALAEEVLAGGSIKAATAMSILKMESRDAVAVLAIVAEASVQAGDQVAINAGEAILNGPRRIADAYRKAIEEAGLANLFEEKGDPGGALAKQLAALQKAGSGTNPIEQMIKRRTETEFNAIVTAKQTGTDPAVAIARVREEYARLDAQWPEVAEAARRAGHVVTDETRAMYDQLANTAQSAIDLLKSRNDDVGKALAEAIIAGNSPDAAAAKVRQSQSRLDALWPRFVEAAERAHIQLDASWEKMFKSMNDTIEQQSQVGGGNLIDFLLQDRVARGLPGLLGYGNVQATSVAGFLTQHNNITIPANDPSNVDVAGHAAALRKAGFGVQ